MEDWQIRVRAELKELNERIDRLYAFTRTPAFAELADVDRKLLIEQHHHMCMYGSTLMERVKRFT